MKKSTFGAALLGLTVALAANMARADGQVGISLTGQAQNGVISYRVDLTGQDADVKDLRVTVNLPKELHHLATADHSEVAREEATDSGSRLLFRLGSAKNNWRRQVNFRARTWPGADTDIRLKTEAFASFDPWGRERQQTPLAYVVTVGDSQSASGRRVAHLSPGRLAPRKAISKLEAGPFVLDSNRDEPDWTGQRIIAHAPIGEHTKAQVELLQTRQDSDAGQLGSVAVWQDLSDNLWAFGGLSFSHSADYLQDRRGDLELHWKLPGWREMVLFGGAGRAEFHDADVRMWTGGATYYFQRLKGGSISYRLTYFDNDFDGDSLRGTDGIGRSHMMTLGLGNEETDWGGVQLRYMYATDALNGFIAATGESEDFKSHCAMLAWRKRWTRQFGTHIQFDWEKRRDLFYRKGIDFRAIWYF